MYTAHITMTGKSYSPKSEWSCFGEDKETAATLEELKGKLAGRYGKSWNHKKPMYLDTEDGQAKRIGWVVGFRNADLSHYPVDKWLQQDWVSIAECKAVNLDEQEEN